MVDKLREYPDVKLPFKHWCHLAGDAGFDELHAFAARLGICLLYTSPSPRDRS